MKVVKRKNVIEITLLSIEEYRAAKDNIPSSSDWWWSDWWWLRSPGINSYCVACVAPDGGVLDCGYYVLDVIGVRPALRIHPKSLNLKIREKVRLGDFTWTYISEGLLLCDSIIKKMPFRKDWKMEDTNDYEASDVKAFLDKWLDKWL